MAPINIEARAYDYDNTGMNINRFIDQAMRKDLRTIGPGSYDLKIFHKQKSNVKIAGGLVFNSFRRWGLDYSNAGIDDLSARTVYGFLDGSKTGHWEKHFGVKIEVENKHGNTDFMSSNKVELLRIIDVRDERNQLVLRTGRDGVSSGPDAWRIVGAGLLLDTDLWSSAMKGGIVYVENNYDDREDDPLRLRALALPNQKGELVISENPYEDFGKAESIWRKKSPVLVAGLIG